MGRPLRILATFFEPHSGHLSGFDVRGGILRPNPQGCLGSVNGGDSRADRLTVADDGDTHCPGVDSGWSRFVEVPEFVALVPVGTQLLNRPRPFGTTWIEVPGQPAFRDPVAFHFDLLTSRNSQTEN